MIGEIHLAGSQHGDHGRKCICGQCLRAWPMERAGRCCGPSTCGHEAHGRHRLDEPTRSPSDDGRAMLMLGGQGRMQRPYTLRGARGAAKDVALVRTGTDTKEPVQVKLVGQGGKLISSWRCRWSALRSRPSTPQTVVHGHGTMGIDSASRIGRRSEQAAGSARDRDALDDPREDPLPQ